MLKEAEAMGELHIAPQFGAVASFVNPPEVALDALWFDMHSPGSLDVAWIWMPYSNGCAMSRAFSICSEQ
jgi:hypothetical protein